MARHTFYSWLGTLLGCASALAVPEARAAEPPLDPIAGAPQYQAMAFVRVPGGHVNVTGGNFLLRRVDLSIDTRLGPYAVEAVYNSADGTWRWRFETSYDGRTFVDPSGARHDVLGLAAGEAIPGTAWVVLDARTLRTKGGLVHEFTEDGRLARVRWASSPTPSLEFRSDPAHPGRTGEIVQCRAPGVCATFFSLDYDAAGRLLRVVDRTGREARFGWDESGRLVNARDGLDVERGAAGFRYAYQGARLVAITNAEGERVELGYAQGRVAWVRQRGEGNPEHRFAFFPPDADALYVTEHTDPLGHVTRYRADAGRRVHEVTNALGERSKLTWSGRRVARLVDPGGVTTEWTYENDDVATELQPSGNVVRFQYAPHAVDRRWPLRRPLLRVEDDLGLLEARSYDAQGRLVRIENGAGEAIAFTYDREEMLATSEDAAGVVTTFSEYGDHGHPGHVARGFLERRFAYDAAGNLVAGDDRSLSSGPGLGGIRSRRFDPDRNVVAVELTDLAYGSVSRAEVLSVEYRSDGRPLRIRRPFGGDTELRYDALGRVVERRERADGVWRATRFEWDAAGRLRAVERPNEMREERTYDAAGRWTERAFLRDGAVTSRIAASYANGRLVALRDSAQDRAEQYYNQYTTGLPVLVSYPDGEVVLLRYDRRMRPVSAQLWLADGTRLPTLERGYDAAGRETRLLADGRLELERVYEHGRMTALRYGNGLERRLAYSSTTGELTGSTLQSPDGEELERTTLVQTGCSGFFCVVAETRTFGAQPGTSVDHYVLGPQTTGSEPSPGPRVAMEHETVAWFVENEDRFFQYDVLSNLTLIHPSDVDSVVAFSYNAEHNRLRSTQNRFGIVHEYDYDAAGFVTHRDGVPLLWDAAGRLAGFGDDRFVWDGLGRPVSRRVGGVETRLAFGGRVELEADGTPRRLDLVDVVLDLGGGGNRYRHLDFRNNVKLVSDAGGELLAHYAYDAYGVRAIVAGAHDDAIGFAQGRRVGSLWLLGHRLYDPEVARFLAPDPVDQLVNGYSYTLGNPVWFWDPTGSFMEFNLVGFGMAVTTVGATVAMGPGGLAMGTIMFVLGIGITVYGGVEAATSTQSPSGNSGAAPGSGGGGSSGGGSSSSAGPGAGASASAAAAAPPAAAVPAACAPTGAILAPEARWLLVPLVPLQLVLALLVARRRARGAPRRKS